MELAYLCELREWIRHHEEALAYHQQEADRLRQMCAQIEGGARSSDWDESVYAANQGPMQLQCHTARSTSMPPPSQCYDVTTHGPLEIETKENEHGQENKGSRYGQMLYDRATEKRVIRANIVFKQQKAIDAVDEALNTASGEKFKADLKLARGYMEDTRSIRDALEAVRHTLVVLKQLGEQDPARIHVEAAVHHCRDTAIWRTQACCGVGDQVAFMHELEKANGGPLSANEISCLMHSYSMTVCLVFKNHFITNSKRLAMRRGDKRPSKTKDQTADMVYDSADQLLCDVDEGHKQHVLTRVQKKDKMRCKGDESDDGNGGDAAMHRVAVFKAWQSGESPYQDERNIWKL